MTKRKPKRPRPWDRKLWGVPILIGSAWDGRLHRQHYSIGEATSALRFKTRRTALEFIESFERLSIRKRLRVVRIRERVEVVT